MPERLFSLMFVILAFVAIFNGGDYELCLLCLIIAIEMWILAEVGERKK